MAKPQIMNLVTRGLPRQAVSTRARILPSITRRCLSSSAIRHEKDDRYHESSSATLGAPGFEHEGSQSRTDNTITTQYPGPGELEPERMAQGRGGPHMMRTLAQFSLQDRVVLVTGGAQGLGLVMAQGIHTSGASVALVDLNEAQAQKSAEILTEQFKKDNPDAKQIPKVTAHKCDVSNPDDVQSTLNAVIESHGKIDHLVTSAGFTENYPAETYPHDRMKKLWGVNVDGTYLFATGLARHLMQRNCKHGSMVLIASMSGSIVNVPQPQAPYNASKAAVIHMAKSFAVEWAHANIRVNTISPGYMLTALTRKILDDNPELNKTWTSLIPVGKMGRPDDLMGPVSFLLSDASLYITGADLKVDGGYTCT